MQSKVERFTSSVPLNCVDKCLLALHSVNEPMLFHIVVDLEGEIDRDRLDRAIVSAQQAHPVMKTIVRNRKLRLSREIQEGDGKGVLSFADQTQLENPESYLSRWISRPLDASKEFPMRALLVRRNALQSSLIFTFHHSAADGLRGLLFVRKVVERYDGELSEDSKATMYMHGSSGRDELLEFARNQRPKVEHYYRKIASSLFHRFVGSAIPPPTRVFHDRSGRSRELACCLGAIGPEELGQFQSKAKAVGVGLNDILLAACHKAVEKWNSVNGKGSNRIRVMVPVNISPEGHRYAVSNHVSWLSFATTPKDRADSARLLRKVKADVTRGIANGMAFSLIYFFYFSSRFPMFMLREMARFLIITRTYVDTILITNLGSVWSKPGSKGAVVCSMGDAKIRNLSGLAPVVTPMGVSVVACTYGQNLNLCLTYRPALLSEERAKTFLDLYIEEIMNYVVGAQGT
jgi:NRPS condensation-like uncharacterized protein